MKSENDLRTLETVVPPPELDDCVRETAAPPPELDDRMRETVAPDPAMMDRSRLTVPLGPDAGAAEPAADVDMKNQTGAAWIGSEAAATSDSREPRQGMSVGKYQLIRELGRGGMGSVFLARDTRLGRLVAIKFLNIQSRELNARFIAEAQTTARCNHENIVVLYEADEYQGRLYMVLEYLEGTSLDRLLDAERAARGVSGHGPLLPVARVVELIVPVLRALVRAHEMGIVHRDLKPANVFLTNTGTVKVLDFGIAKVLADRSEAWSEDLDIRAPSLLAETRGLIGTLPYMSPEQLHNQSVDERTDIWALGIMMCEMVTGMHPLAPLSARRLEQVAQVDMPMPRMHDLSTDLGKLGAVIDRCLIKPVADRMGSAHELLRALLPLLDTGTGAARDADESPFTGLAAFQENDADRFFGRTSDIANLVTKVRSQPLVAVVGPSGVGKSSLVRAGVIPSLKRSGEGWDALIIRPGRQPMAGLTELLQQLATRHSHGQTARPGRQGARMAGSGVYSAQLATTITETMLRREPGLLGNELRNWAHRKLRKLIVFVDQFEEIHTANPDATERAAFLACLASIADDPSSPLRVVFAMRSDFLERLAEYQDFMADVTRGLVFLAPMGRSGLREALEKPLASVGYRFENEGLVDAMLEELEHTPGALPLLQFTATRLWDVRDRDKQLITEDSYQAMDGIAGTLSRHADQVLAGMSTAQVRLARAIFERLVTPERTRAIASMSELLALPGARGDIKNVLQTLANARLLVVESRRASLEASDLRDVEGKGGTVELVHESLIDRWPTLRRWLDENQDDAEFLARLRSATWEWERSGKASGLLWRAEVAHEARAWHERYQGELPANQRAFLDAVFAAEKSAARRKRVRVYSVIVALAVLLAAGAVVASKSHEVDIIEARRAALVDEMAELERERTAAEAQSEQARKDKRAAEAAQRTTEEQRQALERAYQEADTARRALDDKNGELERALGKAEEATAEAEKARKQLDRVLKQYGLD